MRRRLTSLSLLAFLGLGTMAFAQVTGVVNDANNFPESDVEVTVKGTDKVAYTDENGNFNIDAKVGDTLVINGKEFKVTSAKLGALKYQEDAKDLEEVVVLGYGKTAIKAKSNEAVTTVSAEVLKDRPNVSFLNSLQGNAPGISINSISGSPGSGRIDVKIRGLSSINSSQDPLYVIDGLATSGSQFRNLNTEDIETISVLRDAQATSIYGNRGANGVVVITTKSAKYNGGLNINYNNLTSFTWFPEEDYNVASAKELLTIQKRLKTGMGNTMTEQQINDYAIDTDWDKEFMRTGVTQQHNLNLNFGGENVSVYSSLGYLETEGILKSTDFKRFTFRNNVIGKSKNERFKYSSQLAVGYSRRHQLDEEENSSNINGNVVQNGLFGAAFTARTLAPYSFKNGQDMYDQLKGNTSNGRSGWVLMDNMLGGVRNRYNEFSVLANVNGTYKLTDYLTVGNRTGVDYKLSDRIFARDPLGYLSTSVRMSQGAEFGGSETFTTTKDLTFNSVSNISFDRRFGEHTLSIGAYLDYIKVHYESNSASQNGLNPLNWVFGAGTGYVPFNEATPGIYRPTMGATKLSGGTLAYFATLDYDYNSKYGIGATVRRDGSYRFTKDNRWETFWSVSGRWNLDQEEFLKGSSVRMLKLRGSYGTQGNQNLLIASNNFNPLLTGVNLYKTLNSSTTNSSAGYQNLPGYYLSQLGNPELKWELVKSGNIGLDFDLFNGFLVGSLDFYKKVTDRMFNNVTISAVTGAYTLRGNNGKMENKGVETTLKFNILKGEDYGFSLFANGAYNENKISAMEQEDLSGDWVHGVGGPAYQWHLYKWIGVNKTNGNSLFLDKNGKETETPTADDRILTNKSYLPKFTGGFGFNSNYKGFFADALFTFQQGGWSYDNMYSWFMSPSYAANYNVSGDLMNAWTPTNTNTNVPSLTAGNSGRVSSSDRYLYKTDYIRLKNVTVGYSMNKKQLQNLPITGMRIFMQAENLVTWTNWKGYDPEAIKTYSLGIYPNAKSVSLGINVEF